MTNPLIIALDVESAAKARSLIRGIGDAVRFYKVGLELYAAAGPELVSELVAEGNEVFLDLKFHDIGETVRRATSQAAQRGARFLTVHAVPQVMRAAVEGSAGTQLEILGVTVLTSLDDHDLREDGYTQSVSELVDLRVRNAVAARVPGLVCSALEVARVRALAGADVTLVTPGVRSSGAGTGDQKRVATPSEAIRNGANYLVIGRQVTRAAEPRAAVENILQELAAL